MRKPTKTSLKRKLDVLVSKIVRSRGKCEKCGSRENLQACHIFSRKFMNTRFFLDNLLCLCAKDHFWAHQNPILFAEFVKKKLGENKYNLLKEARNQITKFTLADLQMKYDILLKMKKEPPNLCVR